jgi:signal peptidase I
VRVRGQALQIETLMSKKPATAEKSRRAPADIRQTSTSARTIRETVESIVIAFILAFLFRTFEAEAFVIPTGSMAPTLQGMHKDVVCPKCGYRYKVGASSEGEEEDPFGNARQREPVIAGICPMCRFPDKNLADEPTYKGDYILVGKFPFEFFPDYFGEPRRWDVVVFCYPGSAKTNYIKRLIGLPNEIVRIRDGDIHISHDVGKTFAIERKPPNKIRAMSIPVYDNDVDMKYLRERGWPDRWQAWGRGSQGAGGWKPDPDAHSFHTDGAGENWIRYQHIVPAPWDWDRLVQGQLPPNYATPPQLITDFYAYDTNITPRSPLTATQLGLHWVGDLALEYEARVEGHDGQLLLDLVKGGRHFGCRVDVATGEAKFSINGLSEAQYGPAAKTPISGPGTYRIVFANVDQQLLLWVNGSLVVDPKLTAYDSLGNNRPISTPSDPGDLAPVGIGSRGVSVTVNHIKLARDIYYIAAKDGSPITDMPRRGVGPNLSLQHWIAVLSDPAQWHSDDPNFPGPFDRDESSVVEFALETDQFFMLGDNSPYSQDSRLWGSLGIPGLRHYVERKLLIGKAMFIYWPHSFNKIPGLGIPFPFFPNFSDMGFVR